MILNKKKIALICGGSSSERDVSLDGGRRVYSAINKEKYNVDIYDPATDIARLVSDADSLDFAFVVLHGSCGEDGTIQGLLELIGVPYQGSGVLGSAIAMNKIVSKRLFQQASLPVAPYLVVKPTDILDSEYSVFVEDRLGFPVIIKPAEAGSSIGVSIAVDRESFVNVVSDLSARFGDILIESYIDGIEISCSILGNDTLDASPLVEVVHDSKLGFFDYEAKYLKKSTREICPARISYDLTNKAQIYAKMAHKILFCRGYSRTDMILRNNVFYVLETNTIPGMTSSSLYLKAMFHGGILFEDLIEKLIEFGLKDGLRKR